MLNSLPTGLSFSSTAPRHLSCSLYRSDSHIFIPSAAKHPVEQPINPSKLRGSPQQLAPGPQRQSPAQTQSGHFLSKGSKPPQQTSHTKPTKKGSKESTDPSKVSKPADGKSLYIKAKPARDKASSTAKAGNGKPLDTWQINHKLIDSNTTDEILQIYAQHHAQFNIVNLCTALSRIAKLTKEAKVHPGQSFLSNNPLHVHSGASLPAQIETCVKQALQWFA